MTRHKPNPMDRQFRFWGADIVVVGGLAPYFLLKSFSNAREEHLGSLDADLALNFYQIFCYLAPPHSQSASLPKISQLCEMGLYDFLLHVTMDAMLNKKESDSATRASIKEEMAKPRMAKSARTAELNLDTERVPDQARRLCVRPNRKRHRLLWPGRTTGIEISKLKIP
jgi:hypothetical protein